MKKKAMNFLQIPTEVFAAIHEYDCELEFLSLVRRCCRVRGAVKAPGLEMLIADGIVIRAEDGLIPACVAETLDYVNGQAKRGGVGGKSRKPLQTEAPLEQTASKPEQPSNQDKTRQDNNNSEAKASSLSAAAPAAPDLDNQPSEAESSAKKIKADYSPEFLAFWAAFPEQGRSRSGRDDAFAAWKKSGAAKQPAVAMAALAKAKASRQWLEKDGEFIPGVAKWLRRGSANEVGPAAPPVAGMTNEKLTEMMGF